MKIKSQAGNLLISTLSFVILLTVAAIGVLELTMQSYRMSFRNEMRAQARAVADSEMEGMFYQFATQVLLGKAPATVPTELAAVGYADNALIPSQDREPFLAAYRAHGSTTKWRVMRSAFYDSDFDQFFGVIPQTSKQGTITSVTVRVEVMPPAESFFKDSIVVRLGRRLSASSAPIFQFGVFYQNDLELAPGANMTIQGDVSANGSVFLASTATGTLTLMQDVRYLDKHWFNTDTLGNPVLRKPGTPVGGSLLEPVFSQDRALQVKKILEAENLQGGIDALGLVSTRPDLFPTLNDVYRSLILPPPGDKSPNETTHYDSSGAVDPYTTPYDPDKGDDPTIASQRMYNRAGLRITVNAANNAVTFEKVDPATQTVTDVTSTYAATIAGIGTSITDKREGTNVAITTIDVGALKTALSSYSNFNGVLYVNLMGNKPTAPAAVRLVNATSTPETAYGAGFTVATNGGLYLKGNYNTTARADNTTNPALLMADAVTLLSDSWVDADSGVSMYTDNVKNDKRIGDAPLVDGVKQITIEAGILTGNTPATLSNASGGAQNLVRYLEDMGTNSINVLMHGSVGQLFQSKAFTGAFQQPGIGADVYRAPAKRDIQFNKDLLTQPPAGSPSTTNINRGNFFMW